MHKTICLLLVLLPVGIRAETEQGVGASSTNTPSAVSNDIPIVKSPLIFKGLCGPRSGRKSQVASGSIARNALRWLKENQNKDGSWEDPGDPKPMTAGAALLSFLSQGETPASVEFGASVEAGLRYMLAAARADGTFEGCGRTNSAGHAIAAWALCEAYAMTRILLLKEPGDKALAVIVAGQRPSGLWSGAYDTQAAGEDDMYASAWQVVALKSGLLAGQGGDASRQALLRAGRALEQTIPDSVASRTTAPATWCLMYLGQHTNTACKTGLEALDGVTMDWERPAYDGPVFQWYFIAQTAFWNGGELWNEWDKSMLSALSRKQMVESRPGGKDVGYWVSPIAAEQGRKVRTTALCLLMLPPPGRYLPTPTFQRHEKPAPAPEGPDTEMLIRL